MTPQHGKENGRQLQPGAGTSSPHRPQSHTTAMVDTQTAPAAPAKTSADVLSELACQTYLSTQDIAAYLTALGIKTSDRQVREKVITQPDFPEPFRPLGNKFKGRIWDREAVVDFLKASSRPRRA